MDIGNDQFGGGGGGGSVYLGSSASLAGGPPGKSSASDDAYLLSQATNTAMIAARSILMSGGTEETALKTAKAAAQSVLNPGCSDDQTVSGKSTNFLRRRKAKRQAEVVASMALMSATSKVRQGSQDWEMMSLSEQSQQMHAMNMMQYPSNVVAFNSYGPRDEPSVLSGSVRSPRNHNNFFPPPRGPPQMSERGLEDIPEKKEKKGKKDKKDKKDKKPPRPPTRASEEKPPKPSPKQPQHLKKQSSKQSDKSTKSRGSRAPPVPQASQTKRQASMDTARKNLAASVQNEDPIYCSTSQEGNQDLAAIGSIYIPSSSSGDDEETVGTLTTAGENTSDRQRRDASKGENDFIHQHIDPVLTSFTNAFNAFTCGPLTVFADEPEEGVKTPKASGKDRRSRAENKVENIDARDDAEDQNSYSGEETDANDDDETKATNDTDNRDNDSKMSYDSDLKHPLSASRSGSNSEGSSVDSEQIIQELNMSSSTEGEIQVRSSIRETMEKIVSKSKNEGLPDRTWVSYELRNIDNDDQDVIEPPVGTRKEKKKKKKKPKTEEAPRTKPEEPTATFSPLHAEGEDKATKKSMFRFPKGSKKNRAEKATSAFAQAQGSF